MLPFLIASVFNNDERDQISDDFIEMREESLSFIRLHQTVVLDKHYHIQTMSDRFPSLVRNAESVMNVHAMR
jgi:hypothetical protein